MSAHVSFIRRKDCWNPYEALYICVHCGCCSADTITRQQSRLATAKRQLQEQLEFDAWDDDPAWRAIQEKNVKANIRHWRRVIRYYETALNKEEADK